MVKVVCKAEVSTVIRKEEDGEFEPEGREPRGSRVGAGSAPLGKECRTCPVREMCLAQAGTSLSLAHGCNLDEVTIQ